MEFQVNNSTATLSCGSPKLMMPASALVGPTLWLGTALLYGFAVLAGGLTAGTIVLSTAIAAVALARPHTGLWMGVAFMVYACVFYIRWTPAATVEEMGYIGTAVGLAIITMGLGIAWLRSGPRRLAIRKSAAVRRFDKAMNAMLAAFLIATVYGMTRGNGWSAVTRQLFGCLLLPGYYLFARTFFRSTEDIHRWVKRASVVVTAGAVWYVAKLTFLSFSEGSYIRVQSPLAFFTGAIGALLFAEFLWERRRGTRIIIGISLFFCIFSILMIGARFVVSSLVGSAIIILILRRQKHRLLTGLATLALFALGVGFVVANLGGVIERGGLVGGIGARFSPLNVDEDLSIVGRMAQMESILDIVRQHPVLGAGMGAEYSFYDPESIDVLVTTPYVDNGWGFILLKMGVAGLLVFVAMLGAFLRFAARDWSSDAPAQLQRVRACLLALLLFGLLSFTGGPTFFHFTQAGFMGTGLGALAALAELAGPMPFLLKGRSLRFCAIANEQGKPLAGKCG